MSQEQTLNQISEGGACMEVRSIVRIKLVNNAEAITYFYEKGNKCGCYECGAKDSVEAVEMIESYTDAPYRLVSTVCCVCGHEVDKHQRYIHGQGWIFNTGRGFFDGVVPGEKVMSQEQEKTPLQRREEARDFVNEVLLKEKGLRLNDVSKLVDCERITLLKFSRGDYSREWLVDQILTFKERLEENMKPLQERTYTAQLLAGRPLSQIQTHESAASLKVKLLDMIEGKTSEEPVILTIAFYPKQKVDQIVISQEQKKAAQEVRVLEQLLSNSRLLTLEELIVHFDAYVETHFPKIQSAQA